MSIENLIDAVTTLSTLAHNYFMALLEEGFTEEQALFLTAEFQKAVLSMRSSNDRPA